MKGLPSELIYILIFAVILLVQYLTKRGERRESQESPQDEPVSQTPDESPAEIVESEAAPAVSSLPRVSGFGYQLRPPESPTAPSAIPGGRFSKRLLMGNRRQVQNAIVIAAILGPCRAFEPHEVH